MYGGRRYTATRENTRQRQDEIAREIVRHPKLTYAQIADDFCITEGTVRRIAAKYGIGRHPREY
jgi:DNA-binding CsgD family transcriptional regulator